MADTVCNKLAPAAKNFKLALGLAYHAYFPARPAATKTDRIMAGQNHNVVQRCALMILSCHDSVGLLRLQKNSSQPASELDYCSPAQRSRNQIFSKKEAVEREWYSRRSRRLTSAATP